MRLLENFVRKFEPIPDLNSEFFRMLYWFGTYTENPFIEQYIIFAFDCFRFTLWSFKIRRKVPNWILFERELNFLIKTTVDRSLALKHIFLNTNTLANIYPALG